MKVTTNQQNQTNSDGSTSISTLTLTGPLLLTTTPSSPLEAVSKQYVDSQYAKPSAKNIKSGTLSGSLMPAFTGDFSSVAGGTVLSLSPSGVVAGDYRRVTVDSKGRVTSGSALSVSDIPNLSWSKITTGKPTTYAGHGITDGLSSTGGTVTGYLTLSGNPTVDAQVATKGYVDSTILAVSSGRYTTGDVINRVSSVTPLGFFRMNGGALDKTTYSGLYAMVGDAYNSAVISGVGQPWKQQYDINLDQKAELPTWTTGGVLPVSLYGPEFLVTKNTVYSLGGSANGTAPASNVYSSTIAGDGSLGSWTAGTSLPVSLQNTHLAVTKARVFLIGGKVGTTSPGSYSKDVFTAAINTDGTLGAWSGTRTTTTINLPVTTTGSGTFATNTGMVYITGYGADGTTTNTPTTKVLTHGTTSGTITPLSGYANITSYTVTGKGGDATLNCDLGHGQPWKQQNNINSADTLTPTNWTTGTNLPTALYYSQAIVTTNRVYLAGGNSNSGPVSTVYTAPINADGTLGTWTTGTSLPGALWASKVLITSNRVYLLGGRNSTNATVSTVYTAPINADGTLGTWTTGTSLPAALAYAAIVKTSSKVYLIGGNNSSGNLVNTVYMANINIDGTIGGWTSGTNLPDAWSHAQAVATSTQLYLLGGVSGSGSYTSAIYNAPINPDGSLGAWSLSNVSLPSALAYSQVAVISNRVWLFGGYVGSNGDTSKTYSAVIKSNGTLGVWSTGADLPGIMSRSQVVLTLNRVYLLGGSPASTGVVQSSVYGASLTNDFTGAGWSTTIDYSLGCGSAHAVVTKSRVYLLGGQTSSQSSTNTVTTSIINNSDGSLGSWTDTGVPLPYTVFGGQAIVTSSRVYVLGGASHGVGNGKTTPTNGALTATILPDGTLGTWSSIQVALPVTITAFQAAVIGNRLYVMGGFNLVNGVTPEIRSSVYSIPINVDGTIGSSGGWWTWTTEASMPGPMMNSQLVVTSNRIYMLGGDNINGTPISTVYTAPINADKTLGTWTTGTSLPGLFGKSQAVVISNRVYLICGTVDNYNTASGTVFTAPINVDGTLGNWTTAAVSAPGGLINAQAIVTSSQVHLIGYTCYYSAPINGGLNDYSSYYNGTLGPTVVPGADSTVTVNGTVYNFPGSATSTAATTPYTVTGLNLSTLPYSGNLNAIGDTGSIAYTSTKTTTGVSSAVTINGTVYTCPGGTGGTATATLLSANIPVNGSLAYTYTNNNASKATTLSCIVSQSNTYAAPFPVETMSGAILTTKNTVYVIGGNTIAGDTANIYSAAINTDGTLAAWTLYGTLPVTMSNQGIAYTRNRVYLLGGTQAGSVSNNIYTAPIDSNGLIGSWSLTTAFPLLVQGGFKSVYVTRNKLYVIPDNNTNVYSAPINADGTLGTWVTTNTNMIATPPSNSTNVFATKGRLYLIGGTFGAYATISGGSNDYTDGTAFTVSSTNFRLPDYSSYESTGTYYFVKY